MIVFMGRFNFQEREVGNVVKCDKFKGYVDYCDVFDLILDVGGFRKFSFSLWFKFF